MRKQITTQASSRPFTEGGFANKIKLFNTYVKELTHLDEELNPSEREQLWQERITNGYLPFLSFVQSLFGNQVEARNVKAVFRKIASSPDTTVDWSELFGVIEEVESNDLEFESMDQVHKSSVFLTDESRTVGLAGGDKRSHEIVQCITYCPILNLYITVTLHGLICHWTSRFRLKSSMEIGESTWVTGCCTLPDLKKVAVSTERSIVIWDYRTKGKDRLTLYINPIENPPHCLVRVPWRNRPGYQDSMVYGDDQGCLNILTLSIEDLSDKGTRHIKEPKFNVMEPGKLRYPVVRRKIHSDWVGQVKYFAALQMVASCSTSNENSLVLTNLDYFGDDRFQRSLSLAKGINCFSYCTKSNAIVTGGVDKILRIWHPLILTRPTGKLLGHVFTIVDITVNERDQHVISVSSSRIFRVWDIQRFTCLQVFMFAESQFGETKSCCIYYDNKHEFLITGTTVLEVWPLSKKSSDNEVHPHSHDKTVTCVLYNERLNQVASTCKDGCLKIWEVETGQLIHCRTQAHSTKGVFITAMASDAIGSKLITGANDGTIRVWDFVNAQLLKVSTARAEQGSKESSILMLILLSSESKTVIFATTKCKGNFVLQGLAGSRTLTELPLDSRVADEHSLTEGAKIVKRDKKRKTVEATAADIDAENGLLTVAYSNCSWSLLDLNTLSLLKSACVKGAEKDATFNLGVVTAIQFVLRCTFKTPSAAESDNDGFGEVDPAFVTKSSLLDHCSNRARDNIYGVILLFFKSGQTEVYSTEGALLANFTSFPTSVQIKYVSKVACLNEPFQLATGDSSGVITLWNLQKLSNFRIISQDVKDDLTVDERLQSHIKRSIEQTFSWQAHLGKITALAYVHGYEVIISSAADGSVRVWHRTNGHFVGYFGQSTLWNFTRGIDVPASPEKPYDISEDLIKPMKEVRVSMELWKPNKAAKIPLAFDATRWNASSCPPDIQRKSDKEADKKFFSSLRKPRHYNSHLQFSTTASSDSGAVFRSLPVYKIQSPKRLKTPAVSVKEPSWLVLTRDSHGTGKKKRQRLHMQTAKREGTLVTRFPHLVRDNR